MEVPAHALDMRMSPGADEIPAEFVKNVVEEIVNMLAMFDVSCYHSCQHGPNKMRDVLLISLPFT